MNTNFFCGKIIFYISFYFCFARGFAQDITGNLECYVIDDNDNCPKPIFSTYKDLFDGFYMFLQFYIYGTLAVLCFGMMIIIIMVINNSCICNKYCKTNKDKYDQMV